jgi:hypothetical protein
MLMRGERCQKYGPIRDRHRLAADWLQPTHVPDRRWTTRSETKLPSELRPRRLRRFSVSVENLSTHGCRITDSGSLAIGTYAWIILPTLESWYAQVAWSQGGAAGLDFHRPLHRAVKDMLVERAAPQNMVSPAGFEPATY